MILNSKYERIKDNLTISFFKEINVQMRISMLMAYKNE
jgi:hypothetical protein